VDLRHEAAAAADGPVDPLVEDAPEGGGHEAVDDEVDRGVDGEQDVRDGGRDQAPRLNVKKLMLGNTF
jgi:hypothetical protein